MTIVEGQIEPLKKLKKILIKKGIARFNSIGSINKFLKNYDSEINEIPQDVESKLDLEIESFQSSFLKYQQFYDDLKIETTEKTNIKLNDLRDKFELVNEKRKNSWFWRMLLFFKFATLKSKKSNIENNFNKIISRKTYSAENEVIKIKQKVEYHLENKAKIVLERSSKNYEKLAYTKEVLDDLYTLIAGAIGENSTIKEIQKLSDKFILFNDFSIKFKPPIFNKKENDRICSIQIDHLLITDSGVFILETKNWSKQSINNFDLRSPIKQIMRTSYALFVILNSESEYNKIDLNSHHWGNKQIPIRNLIVMTNEKPNEKFKYVKVKSLSELNGYITYFDPIFTDGEVKSIANYLRKKQ